jgi:hypothetical protein
LQKGVSKRKVGVVDVRCRRDEDVSKRVLLSSEVGVFANNAREDRFLDRAAEALPFSTNFCSPTFILREGSRR